MPYYLAPTGSILLNAPLRSITAPFNLGICRRFMISLLVPSGMASTVGTMSNVSRLNVYHRISKRFTGVLARAVYCRRDLQAIGRRSCHNQFTAGNLYYLLDRKTRMGQHPNRDVCSVLSSLGNMKLTAAENRSLLYHLIKLNPHNDITLHVSANNTALVSS